MGGNQMKARILLVFFLLTLFSLSAFAEKGTEILTLDEAIKIALENNPDIIASDASVDMMKAKVRSTKSILYPQVEFRFIIPFIERESRISVDQLIWDFWRTPSLIKSSKAQLESSRFDKSVTQEDVILDTKVAYYTVLAQKHIVEAAEKMVIENEKRLEQIESLFEAGRISKIEVTKAKVNLGNARLNLITGKNNLETAKMRLAMAIGIEGDFNYELEDMLEYKSVDINLERAIDTALERRPELRSLNAKEVGVRADLLASRYNLFFPQVIWRTAYRFEGEGATGPDFIAGIGIRFPIFKGLSDLAGVNESSARLRRLEAEIESMKRQIASEVKQRYLDLKFAEESIKVTEESKTSAEENLELARERYRLGRGSAVELAEAESLVAQTTANHFKAIYNYKIAVAQLERAIGEKIEE
jgi:outer membrane protein TolC